MRMPTDEYPTGEYSETQAALDAGLGLAEPHAIGTMLAGDRFYSVTVPPGAQHQVVDLEEKLDKYRPRPRRKTGTYRVHDADAFIRYYDKHAIAGETEMFADVDKSRVVAIINGHGGDDEAHAGWGDHRVRLELQTTPEWQAWAKYDRKWLEQLGFAEHIEDNAINIIEPSGAEMLEIAQTLSVNRDVQFESAHKVSNGERQFTYRENDNAKAGPRGEIDIPEQFAIGVQPYHGSEVYKVHARLRYRIREGNLVLGYWLNRPEEVLRNAFNDVRTLIEEGTGETALAGFEPGA